MYMHVCIRTQKCRFAPLNLYVHVCMYTRTHTHIQIYISESICTCMYVYAHTNADLYFSIYIYMYVCIRAHTYRFISLNLRSFLIPGGEDAQDALSCRSLSAKEPLIIGLFCRKEPTKIRHPTYLCHPIQCLGIREILKSQLAAKFSM